MLLLLFVGWFGCLSDRSGLLGLDGGLHSPSGFYCLSNYLQDQNQCASTHGI